MIRISDLLGFSDWSTGGACAHAAADRAGSELQTEAYSRSRWASRVVSLPPPTGLRVVVASPDAELRRFPVEQKDPACLVQLETSEASIAPSTPERRLSTLTVPDPSALSEPAADVGHDSALSEPATDVGRDGLS